MSTVAFPTGYNLSRASQFRFHSSTAVDFMSDGTPRQRTLRSNAYVTVSCLFEYLTSTERGLLLIFILLNAGNTITWTIDGINYSGVIVGDYSETMTGPLYSVAFEYYAQIV